MSPRAPIAGPARGRAPAALVLFDIDGTLLLTERAGASSMVEAGRRLVGPHFTFDGIEIAGRLDPLIWADAAAASGVADVSGGHAGFRAEYARILEERLRTKPTARALPGAVALVERLGRRRDVAIGVLTGNYPETGRLKIVAAGFDAGGFVVNAWGDDGPSRRDLPPVAFERYRRRAGTPVDPARVVIIGDTPHDVDCARANGCRALAVATGPAHRRPDLEALAPDLLVEDLADTDAIEGWILG